MENEYILYEINVHTLKKPIMTMTWAKSQKIALKDAVKKLWQRRGVEYLVMDGKEFASPYNFIQYINKTKQINLVCKRCENQMLLKPESLM